MSNNKFSFSFRRVALFFILFPFIQQRTYEEIPSGIVILFYRYAPLIVGVIMLFFVWLHAIRKKNGNTGYIFCLLFWGFYIVNTVIKQTTSFYSYYNLFAIIVFFLFLYEYFYYYPVDMLSVLAFIYQLWIWANFVLMLIYPKGIYETDSYHVGHLLGDSNALIYVILPGVIITTMWEYYKHGKITKYSVLMFAVSEYMFIHDWAASAMVAFAAFIVGIFVQKKFKLPVYYYMIGICSIAVLVFFVSNILIFSDFITITLKKDLTFSGRTFLWEQALADIKRRIFSGYGGFFVYGSYKYNQFSGYYPCHTPFLQILLDGGLVLFGLFVGIMVFVCRKINEYKNTVFADILIIGMSAMFVSYIFEHAFLMHLVIIWAITLNLDRIVSAYNDCRFE